MNRKHMWDMLDVVNSVESGTLAMARVFVGIGLLSLVGIAIDGDFFSVIAAAATISAIASAIVGLAACKLGDWMYDICLNIEFGDPVDAVDLKDWADAQTKSIVITSIAVMTAATLLAPFSAWSFSLLVVPATWFALVKLVKRSANVKIRDLGTDEVEIERWRPVIEGGRREDHSW